MSGSGDNQGIGVSGPTTGEQGGAMPERMGAVIDVELECVGQPERSEVVQPIESQPATLNALPSLPVSLQGQGEDSVASAAGLPQPPVSNGGRDPTSGRFTKGNSLGRNVKHARQASQIRSLLYKVATTEEVTALLEALLAKAQTGDVPACKLCLEYLLGPPQSLDIIQAVASLEKIVLKGPV